MRVVLLLVAVVFAVIVGVGVLQFSNKSAAPKPVAMTPRHAEQQAVATVDILVARVPIGLGTVIEPSMVDTQPWPEHLLLDGFVVSGKSDGVVGKVARASFEPHEPFMAGKLANPNDPSFLAASLPAGMRAITLASDAISGVAGYVFPGDHVDVLFTHNIPQEIKASEDATNDDAHSRAGLHGGGGSKPAITEILVPNVRVMAVNLRPTSNSKEQPISPSSVTVEINETDAQRLRLAEKNGTLSLSLRSIKDAKSNQIAAPSALDSLTNVRVKETEPAQDKIRIVRGVGKDSDNPLAALMKDTGNMREQMKPENFQ